MAILGNPIVVGGGSSGWTTEGIAMATEPSGAITLSTPYTSGYNAAGIRAYAFYGNSAITSITVTTYPNIYQYAFAYMSALTSFSGPLLATLGNRGWSSSYNIFYGCTALTSVYLPLYTTLGGAVFQNCKALPSITLPALTTINNNNNFNGCTALAIADFYAPNKTGSQLFYNCSSLTTLILRGSSVTTLTNINAFTGTPFASGGSGGTIYVPSSLISSYQAATNWSTLDGYGTVTWTAIEGSQYENYYADGTAISS